MKEKVGVDQEEVGVDQEEVGVGQEDQPQWGMWGDHDLLWGGLGHQDSDLLSCTYLSEECFLTRLMVSILFLLELLLETNSGERRLLLWDFFLQT
jgi:hypothetical protein